MGRNIGGHSNSDSGAAVHKQIRKCGGENRWLSARLVVIRDKIDGILLHVGHESGAEVRHTRLGVTHGCRWIAFDRTEIALAIDQPFPHRPRLSHVHEGRVDHCFAVRMIITAGVAADFCALAMLPSREQRQIVHRVKNSSLRRLEAVARVRQRTRNDHRHRVIEERPRHLLGHVYCLDFFVRIKHRKKMTDDE